MKTLTTFAATLAALAAAGPALAGGLTPAVVEPLPVEPAYAAPAPGGEWTGLSAGVSLGYADIGSDTGDGDGAVYGLRGAYDYDLGNWVLGVTGSYDWSNAEFGGGTDSLNSIGRLGLRGGMDLGETLVYATGGAAWADATVGGASGSDSGWFAGIGAERKLGGNWTVGAELLTNRFDDFDGSGVDLNATTLGLNVGMRF